LLRSLHHLIREGVVYATNECMWRELHDLLSELIASSQPNLLPLATRFGGLTNPLHLPEDSRVKGPLSL
jgi:hypothetical protein